MVFKGFIKVYGRVGGELSWEERVTAEKKPRWELHQSSISSEKYDGSPPLQPGRPTFTANVTFMPKKGKKKECVTWQVAGGTYGIIIGY